MIADLESQLLIQISFFVTIMASACHFNYLLLFNTNYYYSSIDFQCCNHIANSKQSVTKRKEAQKLGQSVLSTIESKYSELNSSNKHVSALESAFGSLEIKSNWPDDSNY